MRCPNCDKEISSDFNICPWCAYRPKRCSHSEHNTLWLPIDARFCPICGQPLIGDLTYFNDVENFIVNGVTFKMIRVEGGSFMMGASSGFIVGAYEDQKPTHRVTLDDYYIGETLVTQALWRAVMGDNPASRKGESLPVDRVSWNECQEFIKRINKITGITFSLPTEAQWEYAARGGRRSRGYQYAGSDDINKVTWWGSEDAENMIHPVKLKLANELGLYDMSGNLYEWCQDWYGPYSSAPQTNPMGPSNGPGRVNRGGCWFSKAAHCIVTFRTHNSQIKSNDCTGFRLALSCQ